MGDDREVHAEVPGDKGERQEDGGDNGQPVDDLTLTLVGGRRERRNGVAGFVAAVVGRLEEGNDVTAVGVEILLSAGHHGRQAIDVSQNRDQVSSVGPKGPDDRGQCLAHLEHLGQIAGHGNLELVETGVETGENRFEGGRQSVEHHEEDQGPVVLVARYQALVAVAGVG